MRRIQHPSPHRQIALAEQNAHPQVLSPLRTHFRNGSYRMVSCLLVYMGVGTVSSAFAPIEGSFEIVID